MAKKILIVDDDRDVLELLRERLSVSGYEIITASSGEIALIAAKKHRPDLIILDVLMPDMDGSETAEALKHSPQTKDIPVIFLTCLVTKEDEAKSSHIIGGKYFLSKPYDSSELMKVIAKCLN